MVNGSHERLVNIYGNTGSENPQQGHRLFSYFFRVIFFTVKIEKAGDFCHR